MAWAWVGGPTTWQMVTAAWVSSLCLSLISLPFFFFPLNQASMGLMVWCRSWFDVVDWGGVVGLMGVVAIAGSDWFDGGCVWLS